MSAESSHFFQNLWVKSDKITLKKENIEEIENSLLGIDILPETVQKIIKPLHEHINLKVLPTFIVFIISSQMIKILRLYSNSLKINPLYKPQVILICGANGSGKTSTLTKLTYNLNKDNWNVLIGAGDTFRAAATEQLSYIIEKNHLKNAKLVKAQVENEDPKSLVYRAYDEAKKCNADVLLIDTAGRIYNRVNLMEELSGINRTLTKKNIMAPHNTILIIDGNNGKNALYQVEAFAKIVNINGIIVTKLDSQARCGIILSIVDKFHIPIYGITVGENINDLQDFVPSNFVKMLLKIRD